MPSIVPVNIITGFLGSGKTTLLKHVLRHGLDGQRIAVIVNDMADLNVDGKVIKAMNVDKMVELTSGCICCSGVYQMGVALQEIIKTTHPVLILIETSGAAAAGPVVAELTNTGYRTDSVITVIDGEQFLPMLSREPVVIEQVEEADFLVLNKVDQLSVDQIQKINKKLSRLNPRAHCIETSFGQVSSDLLFATGVRTLRKKRETGHLHPDHLNHFIYDTAEPLDRRRLERFLANIPPQVYRAKGFLLLAETPHPWLLNYTCGRFSLDPFQFEIGERGHTQIAFIGREIESLRSNLIEQLNHCAASARKASLLGRILNRSFR